MDQPCDYADLRDCLKSIAEINRLTLGNRPTLHWLNHVYAIMPRQEKPLHIVDVGCGYGDALRRIYDWAQDRNLPVVLTGIDLNPDAVRAAREVTKPSRITFLAGRAEDFKPAGGIDIVINSLVMHHLENREIVELVDWMESVARMGWFINDLERQPTPYRVFRWMSGVMPWHEFCKHDGAVSILRSFRRDDWVRLMKAAAIPDDAYLVRNYFPGRLCVARLK